jgi:hypothetical protein
MPVHDWTRVSAGTFHHFHHSWIEEIARALNRGVLPLDHYAMSEQIAGGLEPDVLTLQAPTNGAPRAGELKGGISLATTPPRVSYHARTELDLYAVKAKVIAIRHTSNHRVVALVEIVSPGNKKSQHAVRAFVEKAEELIRAGIHLLVIDLFPPGPRDPQGIHKAIWDQITENEFVLPPNRPLTLASYIGGPIPEAFVEPVAVDAALADMPLFLTRDVYVLVPLEATYQAAWEAVPTFWRDVLTRPEVS